MRLVDGLYLGKMNKKALTLTALIMSLIILLMFKEYNIRKEVRHVPLTDVPIQYSWEGEGYDTVVNTEIEINLCY